MGAVNPLISSIQGRRAELTQRTIGVLEAQKAGEGSSAYLELSLIEDELAFLNSLARQTVTERRLQNT
jgi:hypothetical protein